MTTPRTVLVSGLERLVGRRQLVRTSRFVLNHARRDGPNDITLNGELHVQRTAMAIAGDHAVVFDVGANVGQWSSHLVDQRTVDLDLHVFEPSTACVDHLHRSLVPAPGLDVIVNQLAASSEDGQGMLFKPHELAGSSSLHEPTGGPKVPLTEPIRRMRLDTYCVEHNIEHIHLLKIDAEGHDHHVLLGAGHLLVRGAIDLVQFEYNHRWIGARHYLKDVFDLVVPCGYDVGKVTPQGIEWYPEWSPQLETLIEANYVAALPCARARLPHVRWWAERAVRRRTIRRVRLAGPR